MKKFFPMLSSRQNHVNSKYRQILLFGISGAIGFLIELGLTLSLVYYVTLNATAAKLFSFPVAVIVTWQLNRSFTFRQKATGSALQELFRYFKTTIAGAIVNNLTYILFLWAFGISLLTISVATAAGAITGMTVNYLGASRYVFR